MDDLRRRKHERKESLNLTDYVILGISGDPVSRRMGRTINVSEGGILLETHFPLENGRDILITIALEEEIIELKGRVVHVRPEDDKRFLCGVEFTSYSAEAGGVLKKYIKALKSLEIE